MRVGALLGIAVAAGIIYYGFGRQDLPIMLIGVGVLGMALVGSSICAYVHGHGKRELAKATSRLKELEGRLKLAETQPLNVHIHKPT